MIIDKQKLRVLAEAAGMAHGWYQETSFGLRGVSGRSEQAFISAASPSAILALLAEIERLEREADQAKADGADAFGLAQGRADTIDQLKTENEAIRRAMHKVMEQVDGNIRETVRDCVNGRDDVQDIYGYCDAIDEIIDAALAREVSHG